MGVCRRFKREGIYVYIQLIWASLVAQMVKNLPAMQETWMRSLGGISGKMPWRREWQPTPVFLPGKFHGERSLVDYSAWGSKGLDTTEQLNHHRDTVAKQSDTPFIPPFTLLLFCVFISFLCQIPLHTMFTLSGMCPPINSMTVWFGTGG